MFVHTNLDAVVHASIEDELSVKTILVTTRVVLVRWLVRGLEYHQEGLDHVVSMHVHGKLDSLLVQGRNDTH